MNDAQKQQGRQEVLQHRIHELRVAHQELTVVSSSSMTTTTTTSHQQQHDSTNDVSNTNHCTNNHQVYIQLSSGSVAFLTDRNIAEARISRQLQKACNEMDTLPA
jgi:3-polyprenyl-4-hydroxybenzoate decarboxylase